MSALPSTRALTMGCQIQKWNVSDEYRDQQRVRRVLEKRKSLKSYAARASSLSGTRSPRGLPLNRNQMMSRKLRTQPSSSSLQNSLRSLFRSALSIAKIVFTRAQPTTIKTIQQLIGKEQSCSTLSRKQACQFINLSQLKLSLNPLFNTFRSLKHAATTSHTQLWVRKRAAWGMRLSRVGSHVYSEWLIILRQLIREALVDSIFNEGGGVQCWFQFMRLFSLKMNLPQASLRGGVEGLTPFSPVFTNSKQRLRWEMSKSVSLRSFSSCQSIQARGAGCQTICLTSDQYPS